MIDLCDNEENLQSLEIIAADLYIGIRYKIIYVIESSILLICPMSIHLVRFLYCIVVRFCCLSHRAQNFEIGAVMMKYQYS